jgi:hypothetical protein
MFADVLVYDEDEGRVLNQKRPATAALQRLEMLYLDAHAKGRASPSLMERATLLFEQLPLSEQEAGERLCQLIGEYADWEDPEFTRREDRKEARWKLTRQTERAKRVAQAYSELLGYKRTEEPQQ